MQGNSSAVTSAQTAPHDRLAVLVARHLQAPYRREPSAAGRRAFAGVAERLAQAPFVLDAGCGTGAGTMALARMHPGRVVLGIDKSEARLAIGERRFGADAEAEAERQLAGDQGSMDVSTPRASRATLNANGFSWRPANAVLLRCELVDFWQLAAAAGLRCERQYLLYPNPWPKPGHVKRRWHAHPVLPALLALGGAIELRTNWRVYADEFALALRLAGWTAAVAEFEASPPLTPFERKYAASGHALWRCIGAQTHL